MASKTKLTPELKTFKEEIKGLSYKEKLIKYFNLTATTDGQPNEKRAIIRESFNKKETEDFFANYIPVSIAIQEYEDKIRLTKTQIDYNTQYLGNLMSAEMTLGYTLYYINSILASLREKAKEEQNPEEESSLTNICKRMENYNTYIHGAKINIENGKLFPDFKEPNTLALDWIECIKGQLEFIKGLLESLKIFLNKIKAPYLYPNEFKHIEIQLSLFHSKKLRESNKEDREKYKNVPRENPKSLIDIVGVNPISTALHSLVYEEIEPLKYLMENNLWEKSYLREKEDI